MAWASRSKIRKYRKGICILGIFEMIEVLRADRYVIVRGKPYHPAVLRNWSLASLEGICRRNSAHVAELTPEWIAAEGAKVEIVREQAGTVDHEFEDVGEAA